VDLAFVLAEGPANWGDRDTIVGMLCVAAVLGVIGLVVWVRSK
jgi:hypothetical protein